MVIAWSTVLLFTATAQLCGAPAAPVFWLALAFANRSAGPLIQVKFLIKPSVQSSLKGR